MFLSTKIVAEEIKLDNADLELVDTKSMINRAELKKKRKLSEDGEICIEETMNIDDCGVSTSVLSGPISFFPINIIVE